MLTSLQ